MTEIPLNEGLYVDDAIDSLSRRQIRALLRILRTQRDYLNSALDHAERFNRSGQRPGYLVDYDLIHRYMFQFEDNPDWEQELTHLFADESTFFIIGPGTQEEIDRITDRRNRSRFGSVELEFGLTRLTSLLTSANFILFRDVSSNLDDAEFAVEYEAAKKELDRSRQEASDRANRADALNWAAVVCLRRVTEGALSFFPHLLTGTNILLDELFVSPSFRSGIAHSPAEAIYAQILFRTFPEANAALQHAQDMRVALAKIEVELCNSPAFRNPDSATTQMNWEQMLQRDRVGRRLRRQIDVLSKFVEDPIVFESQRVYENAHTAVASLVRQRGELEIAADESPRRLLDLIADVHAFIREEEHAHDVGLAGLWNAVLRVEAVPGEGFVTYEIVDRGPRQAIRTPYLVIERHDAIKGRSHQHFVIRWSSSRDAQSIVDSFSSAFADYRMEKVALIVGTLDTVWEWTGVIPVTLDELLSAARDEAKESSGAATAELVWIRMNGEKFDLYADITVRDTRDPLIGVFGHRFEARCVAELYEKTAARYLFGAWLSQALQSVLGPHRRVHGTEA